jgi:hypothetical protein
MSEFILHCLDKDGLSHVNNVNGVHFGLDGRPHVLDLFLAPDTYAYTLRDWSAPFADDDYGVLAPYVEALNPCELLGAYLGETLIAESAVFSFHRRLAGIVELLRCEDSAVVATLSIGAAFTPDGWHAHEADGCYPYVRFVSQSGLPWTPPIATPGARLRPSALAADRLSCPNRTLVHA